MRSIVASGAAVIVAAALLAGCGDPPPDRVPGPRLLEEQPPLQVVDEVGIGEEGFDTSQVELRVDEAIEVVNTGSTEHRVVGVRDGTRTYDTGNLLPGESTVFQFIEPGEVTLSEARTEGQSVTVVVLPQD